MATFDGCTNAELARRLDVPRLLLFDQVTSTLDVAHTAAADGAPSGTLILADSQTAGRGRGGRRWVSEPGSGIWMTLVERSPGASVVDLLSLRTGLAAAAALDPFAAQRVQVKWPNDLYVGRGKLAGVLIEARWRAGSPEWIAIGVGINVRPACGAPDSGSLLPGTDRIDVLAAVIPALRDAAVRDGPLSVEELAALERRDFARGRAVLEPEQGRVEGISSAGELLLRAPDGALRRHRAGSLVFAEES